MNRFTEHFEPSKELSSVGKLDAILNHVRGQLDFLCMSADYQNNSTAYQNNMLYLLTNGKNEDLSMDKENMKKEALELLNKIDSEKVLWMVLGTLKAGFAEQEAVKMGVIDGL